MLADLLILAIAWTAITLWFTIAAGVELLIKRTSRRTVGRRDLWR